MSEIQRQRDLDTYRIVDSLPEAAYDDLVRLAARLCDAPVATLSLIDRDRQWFKSRIGIESMQTPRELAFCDHAIREPQLLMEVTDASRDPRFRDHPDVTGGLGIRFYAGMPLVTPNGTAVGTVCVIDHAPRTLDDAQREALASLARIAMNLLESRRQLLDAQRAAAIHAVPAAHGEAAPASRYSVAILQLQDYAATVRRHEHRQVEQALLQCEHALERLLGAGESLSRLAGGPEFVLTLEGDATAARMEAIERVGQAAAGALGTTALAAAAGSRSGTENPLAVFERADEALTLRKSAQAGIASMDEARVARH
ncbi:MAG TPA: GAF domain-containing protein [Lysobacter sp.]|nr:GAF domain-containing protein [Lysobacter sp.]